MRGWQDYCLPDAMFAPTCVPLLGLWRAIVDRVNCVNAVRYVIPPQPLPTESDCAFALTGDGAAASFFRFFLADIAYSLMVNFLVLDKEWSGYGGSRLANFAPQVSAMLGEKWIDWETPTTEAIAGTGSQIYQIMPTAKICEQTCQIIDSLRTAAWYTPGEYHRVDITDQVQFLLD